MVFSIFADTAPVAVLLLGKENLGVLIAGEVIDAKEKLLLKNKEFKTTVITFDTMAGGQYSIERSANS